MPRQLIKEATMNYPTHNMPSAGLDSNTETGQKFGEAGQELALERGESIEVLQNEQDRSLSELEQELLFHVDGVIDEIDTSATAADKKDAGSRSDPAPKTLGGLDEVESKNPVRSINR
jgi:hypothetical protein